jgi:hypothetical protein
MNIAKRIPIIFLVFIVTGLIFLPLAGTTWAEGVRAGATPVPPITASPVTFIKVIVEIGLPALITVSIRNATKHKKMTPKTSS